MSSPFYEVTNIISSSNEMNWIIKIHSKRTELLKDKEEAIYC